METPTPGTSVPPQIAALQQASQEAPFPGPTQVPVESVDADQLPRERAWTYEEIATLVGGLYLDSHQRSLVMQEQFGAMRQEYEATIMRLQAENERLEEDNKQVRKQLGQLQRELEARSRGEQRTTITPDSDG